MPVLKCDLNVRSQYHRVKQQNILIKILTLDFSFKMKHFLHLNLNCFKYHKCHEIKIYYYVSSYYFHFFKLLSKTLEFIKYLTYDIRNSKIVRMEKSAL